MRKNCFTRVILRFIVDCIFVSYLNFQYNSLGRLPIKRIIDKHTSIIWMNTKIILKDKTSYLLSKIEFLTENLYRKTACIFHLCKSDGT